MSKDYYYAKDNLEYHGYTRDGTPTKKALGQVLNDQLTILRKSKEKETAEKITIILDWLAEKRTRFTKENILRLCLSVSTPPLVIGYSTKPFPIDKDSRVTLPDDPQKAREYIKALCSAEAKLYACYLCTKPLDYIFATLLCIEEQNRVLRKCVVCGKYFPSGKRKTDLYCSRKCKDKVSNRKRLQGYKKEIHDIDKIIRNAFTYLIKKGDPPDIEKEYREYCRVYKHTIELYDKEKVTKEQAIEIIKKYYRGRKERL